MVARRSASPLGMLWPEIDAERSPTPPRRCIRTAERSMAETRFDHLPAGNLKPAKDKSTERIDGIVAAIMAIGRAMLVQEKPQPAYSMFFV